MRELIIAKQLQHQHLSYAASGAARGRKNTSLGDHLVCAWFPEKSRHPSGIGSIEMGFWTT